MLQEPILWEQIAARTNEHGYMSGVDRQSERVKATAEIFTPTALVIDMLKQMLEADPTCLEPQKTVLDPACGDGQLLVPIKWYRVFVYGCTEAEAVSTIYGVDIMRDNVDLCKKRLGGGNIYMGNTLEPLAHLGDEQTEEERTAMRKLFSTTATLDDFL